MADRCAAPQPLLSVVIKSLNEEEKIGACLTSVLQATKSYPTQVIVADSRSDDGTVDVARRAGVNVVALAPSVARGCGVGAQLGFQHATGRYVLLLDGDMQLDPSFLPEALRTLEDDADLAGVGGGLELDAANLEYRLRRERGMAHLRPGFVNRLDGGGLYRRAAVESVGYLADQNMHSFEEFDLALRLRQAGWRLKRIATPAVFHRGHTIPALSLLFRRWRNHYTDGQGEALRAALGSKRIVPLAREFWISFVVIGWWVALGIYLLLALFFGLSLLPLLASLLLPLAALLAKKRSLALAGYSFLQWQVIAAGMIRGLLRPRRDPRRPVPAVIENTSSAFPIRPVPELKPAGR